ncbi:zinc finger and BTB domain-containing protein 24-like isoform X5 [Mya arenaria]|uniref:zinc finger and BTB domain-containing protein 24-like isoform X5 n=1 Tax=Mya arenaria TaxID=6604 RepID=UPI0022E59333|nr:zinc finger and BTB domain-containing protein 24-like isoform X5 [Mya arenaria]XP_052763117.1 zinc finger and BTB domain-containing protein 24-like isoform X5 [Mya arenaria]
MAPPDMDVIKEVPGYKVILKAVLKAQIQQLIEQLATTTEEESIIITASVADGTLSHLGSDSAKGFLEDHEDVKSQFLGYCLKTHHQRKQEEKERKDLEAEVAKIQQALPPLYPSPRGSLRGGYRARAPRFTSPRFPGVRHEPYSVPRTPSVRPGVSPMATEPKTNVKTEPYDPNMNTSGVSLLDNDDDNSKSSSSTIPTEQGQEGMGQGSGDVSGLVVAGSADDDNDTDNVTIKQEILQGEEDLEITGVEPGMPIPTSQAWDPNAAMGMNFDPSGATGSQADLAAQQGYNFLSLDWLLEGSPEDLSQNQPVNAKKSLTEKVGERYYVCEVCNKLQPSPSHLQRHMRTHTGEKPYSCDMCASRFTRKDNLEYHKLKNCGKRASLL